MNPASPDDTTQKPGTVSDSERTTEGHQVVDRSIQSDRPSEEIDRLIRQKQRKQRKIINDSNRARNNAARKAFYKSTAYKKTAKYQRDLDNREAKGRSRKPNERIIKSAQDAGHLLWTRF